MTEREFDDIFKDKLGDELPFDFRTGDWQSAVQELDKVMPVVPLVTPNPVVSPAFKILAWHKWAAAAAVLAVVSQGWLLAKLYDISHELNTLKQQNSVAAASIEKQSNTANSTKNTEGVIIRDTIIKYVEVPAKAAQESTYKMGNESKTTPNNPLTQNNEAKALITELNHLKKELKEKNNIIEAQKTIVTSAIARAESKNGTKADNNLVNNTTPVSVKDKTTTDKKGENKEVNNNPNVAQNNSSIDKINTPNNSATAALDKNAVTPSTANSDVAEVAKERLALDKLNLLPSLGFNSVKSNFKEVLEMNAEDLYLMHSSRRNIIKPLPELSNWKVGANMLTLLSTYERGRDEKESVINKGYNARLMYTINNNWRASADLNLWKESYEPHIDSFHRTPPVNPPSPDYKLTKISFKSDVAQLRIGADYLIPNKTVVTPFIGFGLAYRWATKKDIEFEFKNTDPNKTPLPPFAVHNDDKETQSPYYFSLRAGVEGKIYKRLSWSANITSQLRLNSKSNQIWGSQVGLCYAL